MKKVVFQNGKVLTIKSADCFWTRLCGLLGSSSLSSGNGMLIIPCNSVHMFGMKYAIDVIYLNKDNVIIKIVENLKPWIGISCCFQAVSALEIGSGMAKIYHLQVGQKLFE